MVILGILFELYLSTFAHFAGYHPCQFSTQSSRNYIAPLKGEIELIGNCGELRANHFHTGWDLSTQGKEGAAVFAIEDGFVSRIRISSTGYGKAIYITHSNGLTSVYAHLSRFSRVLDSLVLEEMKVHKQNEFDWYWPATKFKLSKGSVMAYSGNTGSSTGPHLHFELRDAFTELVYNPAMIFEDQVIDDITPYMTKLGLSHLDENGVRDLEEVYIVKDTQVVVSSCFNTVNLSIAAEDKAGKGLHHLGVYELFLRDEEGKIIYSFKQDKLNFSNGRFANAVNDNICAQKFSKQSWYTLFQSINNDWPSRKHYDANVDLSRGDRKLSLLLKDEKGLQKEYSILIKRMNISTKNEKEGKKKRNGIFLNASTSLDFSPQDNTIVFLPSHCLYENVYWPIASTKNTYPAPFHKPAKVKMIISGIALSHKLGSYAIVKQNDKVVEKTKILWKGDTAIFEIKQCGEIVYKYAEKLPFAKVNKGTILLENIEFLSQYNVVDATTGEWLPVVFQAKSARLHFIEKGLHPKRVKVYCKDIFGRETVQELEFSR